MSQTYPLVVYGPQGEPRDVFSADEEAVKAALGYRRHWHMGGTYGLPLVPPDEPTPSEDASAPPVSPPAVVADEAPLIPAPAPIPRKRGRPRKKE